MGLYIINVSRPMDCPYGDYKPDVCVCLCVSYTGYEMTLMFTLSAQSAPVLSCAISFDGQLLVSG